MNSGKYYLLMWASVLSGCQMAPSLPVFGAGFPDWLFCLIAAAVATGLMHWLMAATVGLHILQPAAISYPAFFAVVSKLLWLAFFSQ